MSVVYGPPKSIGFLVIDDDDEAIGTAVAFRPPPLLPLSLSLSLPKKSSLSCVWLCDIYNPSRIDPRKEEEEKRGGGIKGMMGIRSHPKVFILCGGGCGGVGVALLLPFSLRSFHASHKERSNSSTTRDCERVKTKDEKSPNLLIWFAYCLLSAALGRRPSSLCPFGPSSEKGNWRVASGVRRQRSRRKRNRQSSLFGLFSVCLLHHLCKKTEEPREDWRRLRLREREEEEAPRYLSLSLSLFLSLLIYIFYFEKCMSDSCMDASSIIGWLLPKEEEGKNRGKVTCTLFKDSGGSK